MPSRRFTLLVFWLLPTFLLAQATFSGQVLDANSKRAIANADIQLKNNPISTRSDQQGYFSLQVLRSGRYTLTINTRGYHPRELDVQIYFGCGSITVFMEPKLLGSQIWEDWTPTLSRHVTILPDTLMDQKLGNQDLPEIFRHLAGSYVSRQGGGWGDSRIHLHGFAQQEIAFTLNGIPLNDPENGQFYWSRWSVLRHLQPLIHYKPGAGQSLLTNDAVGGELSMLSLGVEVAPHRSFTHSRGNDNFQSYRLEWQHGLGRSQWGLTAMLAHDRGDGYVDGTEFQAYSYFLSLEKKLNARHRLTLTLLGSSQWHHRRTMAGNLDQITLRTFVNPDGPADFTNLGLRYNHEWGQRAGETFSARRDVYSQPLYSVNHLWQLKPKLKITTVGYGYHGRGGETGLRGRIWSGISSIGETFIGFGEGIYDSLGQIRFDDIIAYNQGDLVADFGNPKSPTSDGQYIVSRNGRIGNTQTGSGFVRRASINNTDQYGVASMATYSWSKKLHISAGVDYRKFRSQHFRRVEDLLGADGYLAQGNINEPENLINEATPATFGDFGVDAQAESSNVLNYNYRGQISTLGLIGRIGYDLGNWQLSGQLNRGQKHLSRIDYFNYDPSDTPENDLNEDGQYHQSPVLKYTYHNYIVGGARHLGKGQSISAHYSQAMRAPFFDEVFEGNRNQINTQPSEQQASSWVISYGIQKSAWQAQLQVYRQSWSGQVAQRNLNNYAYLFQGDTLRVNALARFTDVQQLREGIDLTFTLGLERAVQLNGRLGLGKWRFPQDQIGIVTDLDNQRLAGKINFETADLPLGDAAQTTLALGIQWKAHPNLFFSADYFFFDRLYAPWSIARGLPEKVLQLPSYSLMDLQVKYRFFIGKKLETTLLLQINNLLDEIYISDLGTSIADNPSTPNVNELYDNRGNFGFGRTWNAGLRVRF